MNLDPSKSTFRNHTHEHSYHANLIKKYIFSESQKKGGGREEEPEKTLFVFFQANTMLTTNCVKVK
ncbi:hypothetical protein NC651_033419 [Populus alba x Populus x berolinensis]|nr:hypothetical protein NC651_033419 [Populus alba x Populus x berolinensis]